MVWGCTAHEVKSQQIVVEGNVTAVRYRDEIIRPVAVPRVQQHQLILKPLVARVCRDFLANNNIFPLDGPPYGQNLTPPPPPPPPICGTNWTEE